MMRVMTTFNRNAATDRKMIGMIKPTLCNATSSESRYQCESCKRARDGPQAAVGLEQPVESGDDVGFRGPGHQRQRDIVESALHVKGGGQGFSPHPKQAEAPFIGQDVPRPDVVDILGRQRDADDLKLSTPAVQDRRHRVPRCEPAGEGETFGDQHFVRTTTGDVAPLEQRDVVQGRRIVLRDRDQAPDHRLVEILGRRG